MVCVAKFVILEIKMVLEKECVKTKLILESHRNARRMSFAFLENVNISSIVFVYLSCHDAAPPLLSPACADTWDTWSGHR